MSVAFSHRSEKLYPTPHRMLVREGGPVGCLWGRLDHSHHPQRANSAVLLQHAWNYMDRLLVARQLLTWRRSCKDAHTGTCAHPCQGAP